MSDTVISIAKLKPSVDKILAKVLKSVDEPVVEYIAKVICGTAPASIRDDSFMHSAIGELLIAYDIASGDAEAEAICKKLAKEIGNVSGIKPITPGTTAGSGGADSKSDSKTAALDSKSADAKSGAAAVSSSKDVKSKSRDEKGADVKTETKSETKRAHTSKISSQPIWEVASDSTRHLIRVGMHVMAKYDDGSWYDAVIERFKGNNFGVTFTGYGNEVCRMSYVVFSRATDTETKKKSLPPLPTRLKMPI